MTTSGHIADTELALFITRDLPVWRNVVVRLHVSQCKACQDRAEAYRSDRQGLLASTERLPEGLDWESLAAEMTANVHLGLEAGECVTPRPHKSGFFSGAALGSSWIVGWKPAAMAAGVVVLLTGAWWLNVPAAQTQSLFRSFRAMTTRDMKPSYLRGLDDRTPVVEVSAYGITVRENGSQFGMAQKNEQPLAVSVSSQGSASAHYVNAETGQVTVTSVYVQ